MKKQIITAAAILFAMLYASSCADAGNSTPETTVPVTKTETENIATEAVTERSAPDLPEEDFGEYEFRVLEYELNSYQYHYDFDWSSENAGDLINDAVAERNMRVEEKYNCRITAENVEEPDNVAKRVIASDSDEYDLMEIYIDRVMSMAPKGLFVNFYEIPYVSVDQPWWDQQIQEELAMFGKLFCMTGDISIFDEELNYCIYFNKKIAQLHDIEDPYALAKKGKWTIDKLMMLGRDFARDLNGDGKRDENDSYGVLADAGIEWLFFYTGGCRLTKLDDDHIPYFTASEERAATVADKAVEFICDQETVLWASNCSDYYKTIDEVFMDDRALFRPGSVYNISGYRNMMTDFGVLPYPKFDEEQEDYVHPIATFGCPGICVPATNSDLERTGIILEALAYESKDTVTHAYYEVNLYSKLTRDNESEEMFDIIFGTKHYDLALVFDWGGAGNMIKSLAKSGKKYATVWAERESAANSAMQKTLDAYQKFN